MAEPKYEDDLIEYPSMRIKSIAAKTTLGVIGLVAATGAALLAGDKFYVQPKIDEAHEQGRVLGYYEGEQDVINSAIIDEIGRIANAVCASFQEIIDEHEGIQFDVNQTGVCEVEG